MECEHVTWQTVPADEARAMFATSADEDGRVSRNVGSFPRREMRRCVSCGDYWYVAAPPFAPGGVVKHLDTGRQGRVVEVRGDAVLVEWWPASAPPEWTETGLLRQSRG